MLNTQLFIQQFISTSNYIKIKFLPMSITVKSLSKAFMRTVITSDIGWKVISPLAKAGISINRIRKSELKKKAKEEDNILNIFKEMKVLHGPFEGMKYPSFKSVGSTLYSKLLGSYEWEIHAI